jgi:hypothetical protein
MVIKIISNISRVEKMGKLIVPLFVPQIPPPPFAICQEEIHRTSNGEH